MARWRCQDVLASNGFQIKEQPFEYSAWPGRYATPAAGVILALTGCWIAWEAQRGTITCALSVGTILLAIVALGGLWMGRNATVTFPFLRRRGVNLEAIRAPFGDTPTVWLVAHIDSKSQLVPLLLRIVGVVLCIVTWTMMYALWAATFTVTVSPLLFAVLALVSTLGALPLVGTMVGTRSDGALDNASGVATILTAARYIDPALPLGVLVTSAEELGLAGARAWVYEESHREKGGPRPVVINCDGIDDRGELVCMFPRKMARFLNDVLQTAGRATGSTPRIRGVLPGVLVDAVAFTQAGWPALTISRGRRSSLARIHTHRDDLSHMTGSGIDEAARFMAQLATAIGAKRAEELE